MKHRIQKLLVVATGALLGLSAANPSLGGEEHRWLDDDDSEAIAALAVAGPLSDRLLSELQAAVATALSEGGVLGAIGVCHLQALPLTAAAMTGANEVREVKRTSLRWRNPANAPDEADQIALRYFEALAREGRPLPSAKVQKSEVEDEWNVYKPLRIGAACLQCHGDETSMSAETRRLLARLYPADTAVGYTLGEWRGLVRVSVAALE